MKAVILLAGGKGIRFNAGYNKLLYEINGKKIFEYSLDAFKDYKIYFVSGFNLLTFCSFNNSGIFLGKGGHDIILEFNFS